MKYKTYLFDFDGTLVDSMSAFVCAVKKILDENHIKYTDDIVKIVTPLGYRGTAEYFQKMGLRKNTDELVNLLIEYSFEDYKNCIPAKKHVVKTLETLKENGSDLNVLTAAPHRLLDVCLKRLEIFDLFSNVWSCDDFGISKTNPEIYIKVAGKLGKNVNEILFLDDNFNADKIAKEAGMSVCGVYDESSKQYVDEIKGITDHYIYDFSELLE